MPPDTPSASRDALQFDHAVPGAAALTPTSDAVPCSACREPVGAEYWEVGGAHVCARCRDVAADGMRPVRERRLVLRAALAGLGAAIAGAAVYYGVVAITGFEIGIVAILIGWMVGRAVRAGARGRGGRRLQVLAVALTYVSVAFAYLPLAMQGLDEGSEPAATSVLERADTTAAATAAAVAATDSAATEPLDAAGVVAGLGFLLAFTLALPVIAVAGSMPSGLLSALIIGIGMHQAWGMTGIAHVPITGPYRVAARRDGADAGPTPAT